jgi:hypothetical protein
VPPMSMPSAGFASEGAWDFMGEGIFEKGTWAIGVRRPSPCPIPEDTATRRCRLSDSCGAPPVLAGEGRIGKRGRPLFTLWPSGSPAWKFSPNLRRARSLRYARSEGCPSASPCFGGARPHPRS